MNIFKDDIEILRLSLPAKISKRFVCCLIDMIIVIFVAGALFLGLFQITKNSIAYKNSVEVVNQEIEYYEKMTEDTHIVEYVNGERVSLDVIVFKNVCRAICLSYEKFGNEQQLNFSFDSNHDVALNGIHSLENDNISYFYKIYLKNNEELNINITDDLFDIYKDSFGTDANYIFTFNKDVSELPILNTQVAYYMFYYLFINETDEIGQTGATYYQVYYNAYSNMLEEAEMLVLKSEPYYSTHYLKYKGAYCDQARYTNITLLIAIFIASLIVLLVPKFLFKNEKTISYKLFGLGVINLGDDKNKWFIVLIKTIIECFGFILVAFIIYLFPPFDGVYESMFIPMTIDSRISLALILLIILIMGAFVNVFGLFTFNRQNLLNLIFNDVVVDIHSKDDGRHEELNQGRSY